MKTPVYLALKSMVDMMDSGDESGRGSEWYNAAVAALKQEEAQTAEPAAWMKTHDHGGGKLSHSLYFNKPLKPVFFALAWLTPLFTRPEPTSERGEVVVTFSQDGQIQAVTRQDEEGKILSVIAESRAA